MSLAWLWGIFLVGAMVLLAVAGTLLARRWVGVEVLKLNNEVAGFIYAVIGVVYAVLLGFTAIIVWEQYDKAQAVVDQEANELADLYRNAQTFPDDVRRELEARLRTYARLVVEKEWPAMVERKSSPETWDAYNQLWRTYHLFQPENEHEKIWYAQSLAKLLGAGVVTIGFSFLFGTRSATAQVLMTAGLAMVIALVLLSIMAMQHPFAGITRVDADAFAQLADIFDVWSHPGAGQPR